MKQIIALLIIVVGVNSLWAQEDVNADLPNKNKLTKAYLEGISERKIGQTEFATKRSYSTLEKTIPAVAQEAAADREIQESDVYKLGKEGRKELLLLNRYRGLQIISFNKGLENPEITGRYPVYNNWNSEMYYLKDQDQILVLNTEWSYTTNHWQTNYKTLLYLLDVKDPSNPTLLQSQELPGYLSSSRLVGDVLYTITSSRGYGYGVQRQAEINSVKISKNSIQQIDRKSISSENKYFKNMNVVKNNDSYYVISNMTHWGRSARDTVVVHDITDAGGAINEVLKVKAVGRLAERSQTIIHKDHLVIVSNYTPNPEDRESRRRISVEAVALKKSSSLIESTKKMRISVGDTRGQHANLQDVRVSGDLLYTFWVPANNIDPFDMFDLSNPSEGIKHLGRLEFDGWIERSFPLELNGKKYVFGLGQIVPVTEEGNRRFPQAKLFEISEKNGKYTHSEVATLTLDSGDLWTRFNQQDKFFSMVKEEDGSYNVMFPAYFYSANRRSAYGGKIINVNLETQTIAEGSSIVGEERWLKRVFNNPEIRGINTFSDQSLATFSDANKTNGFAEAVSVLELARDIVDFKVISANKGIQLVKANKSLEARVVPLSSVDAEQADVLQTLKVNGEYVWHKAVGNKIYTVTKFTKEIDKTYGEGENQRTYKQTVLDYLNFNTIYLDTLSVKSKLIDYSSEDNYHYVTVNSLSTEGTEILNIGRYNNKKSYKLEYDSLSPLQLDSACESFVSSYSDIRVVNGQMVAHKTFNVKAVDEPKRAEDQQPWFTTYDLPYVKNLTVDGDTIKCSAAVNVPGDVASIQEDIVVVRETSRYGYYYPGIMYEYTSYGFGRGVFYNPPSKTYALKKVNGGSAVELTDILNKDITRGQYSNGFITYSSSEARLDVWRVIDGQFMSRPYYMPYTYDLNHTSLVTVKEVSGRTFVFMKNSKKLDLFEVEGTRVNQLGITSAFDKNTEDMSATYVFAINSIEPTKDLNKFIISQGFYGVTELVIQ